MTRAAALLLAVLTLAGCAADSEPVPPSTLASSSSGAAGPVRVGLTEWTIALRSSQVPAGAITLLVTNAGATTHDLFVRGAAGTWHTDDLRPGDHEELPVRARAGEVLELWCDEPGHAAAGMRTQLEVQGG